MLKRCAAAGCVGFLMVGTSMGADLPKRNDPPMFVPVPIFTWNGFYIGINAGYAFSAGQKIRTTGLTTFDQALIDAGGLGIVNLDQGGATAGGGLGYNYQLTPGNGIVVGFEADLQYVDLGRVRTTAFDFSGATITVSGRQSLDFLGTVRGRVGYAFDKVLVYGTGGFAYGDVAYGTRADISLFGGVPFDASRFRGIENGFAYGGGIEIAIQTDSFLNFLSASAVSVKAEYLHYDLGQRTLTITGIGPVFGAGGPLALGQTARARFQTEGSMVRAGINYKFSIY